MNSLKNKKINITPVMRGDNTHIPKGQKNNYLSSAFKSASGGFERKSRPSLTTSL